MLEIQKFVRPYNLKAFLNIAVRLKYLLWNIFYLLKYLIPNRIGFRKTVSDCFGRSVNLQLSSGQHIPVHVSAPSAPRPSTVLSTFWKLTHGALTEIAGRLLSAYFNHKILL